MAAYEKESDLSDVISLVQKGICVIDVPSAFRHFLAIDIEVVAVKPVLGHGIRSDGFKDRPGVIMMPKEVINPPTIDGQGLIKVLADHAWILNVPGWSA